MDQYSNLFLALTLLVLIIFSGFFSSSETSMLSLNRYRLKHLKKNGHIGARKASRLLQRTDLLISIILIGNNFVNILASSIATVLAIRIWGDAGIAIATGVLTLVVLIFAEITPKTVAAYYPEKIAFPAAYILSPLLKLLYPLVFLVNQITSLLLSIIGIKNLKEEGQTPMSGEELRTVVDEAGNIIPRNHRDMLLSILDLEKVAVNDIMIPRNEIVGINLDDDIEDILQLIKGSQHTRLPLYKGDINEVKGILHLRNMNKVFHQEEPNKAQLLQVAREPYFIPDSTPLNRQLINFQKEKRRIGFVVDEYGEVVGIATLEDILEEIVGEFTTDFSSISAQDIIAQDDGSFLIDGQTPIRVINKTLTWELPMDGPKTLSGLITEGLESIPEYPTCLKVMEYIIEIRQTKDNVVKTVQVTPPKGVQKAQKP